MRARLMVIFISLVLLISYISVEAKSGDDFLGSEQFRISPLLECSEPSTPKYEDIEKMLAHAPVAFTENLGQIENENVRFYVQGGGLWFTDDGVWFELREYVESRSWGSEVRDQGSELLWDPMERLEPPEPMKYKRVILKQEFVGANLVKPEGRERLKWNSNFFYGNDSTKWCTNVPNYRGVYYENLYDGIDLRYYSNEKGLKYDLIVQPGADIKQIRIRYEGAEELKIDDSGNLVIKNPIEDIIDSGLLIYQDFKDCRKLVEGSFVKFNNIEYGFKISDDYNHQEILVIDPTVMLEYSTLVGSSASHEYGYGVAADIAGNAYITGSTYSATFPVTPGTIDTSFNGVVDAFVFKLNSNGSELNYSTFIGGMSFENSYDIAVDPSGNAFITGTTRSTDFPTTKGAFQETKSSIEYDAFITKLNHNGTALLYSTYIQGGNNEYGQAITIDSSGNAFVTGETVSIDFPTTNGSYKQSNSGNVDVFVLKMNQTGDGLIYSTYIGGSSQDNGYGIVIDNIGNAFVTGGTRSSDFPTTEGAFNRTKTGSNSHVFVLKLNKNGSTLNYSTYVGGYNNDIGYDIAIDLTEQAIVTGITNSLDFPNTTGAFDRSYSDQYDVFVFKLNQTGSGLRFSTYVGGSGQDYGYSVDVDSVGNIYITGITGSSGFPVTNDAYDNIINGSGDSFLLRMNPDGSALIYSTFIGGSSSDTGYAIGLDQMGNAYITGHTYSSDFPTTPGAYKSPSSGFRDVFVVKFSFEPLINISSVSLLKENKPTTKAYSRLCPYTFRVNVIDTANITDLTSVVITLDPPTTNIQLLWDSSTGSISKRSDPIDYITIDPSSKAFNLGYLWTIDFNVIFNWNYPDENFQKIQAYATSKTFPKTWYNRSSFYCVETDLTFNGTLLVTNDENNTIFENDLIRGGERLNWTGLTTVYEGTNDIFPPVEVFNVTLKDQTGLSWNASPLPGEPFFIETFTSPNTDIDGNKYKLTISEIPKHCDASNHSFTLRIDGDNVTFSNQSPDNSTWQTVTDVLIGVNIIDYGGGVVDGKSVEYDTSINDGITWNGWESINGLTSAVTVNAQETVTLNEGIQNLIKWRAYDSVGNGPTESDTYRILIDTKGVEFSNAWPSALEVSKTEEVEVGITISDEISGVDTSTIQYSVSENKGNAWGGWENVKNLQNGVTVVVRINLTLPNGTDNMLRWRAFDIADNGPEESTWQVIKIDTWVPAVKPKVILISPPNGVTINKTSVEFNWELEDKTMENVTYNLYIDNETQPRFMITDIKNSSYVIDELEDGETYYWRVIPVLGDIEGLCTSGSWWFKVELSKAELEKIYKLKITGRDSISIYPGQNKSITLSITNLGEAKDTIRLELEAGKLSDYIYLEDYSMIELESNRYALRELNIEPPMNIKPGTHVIIITAISVNSGEIVRESHVLEIEILELESKPDDSKANGTDTNGTAGNKTKEKSAGWLNEIMLISIIVIIVMIILLLVVAMFIKKRKKRAEQELLAPGTFAIKPGALPSPVITLEQVGGASAVQQLPGTAAAGVSTQPTTVMTPVPTLASAATAAQAPPPQQIPQVPQLPQLPPAQIQAPTPTVAEPTPTTTEAPPTQLPAPTGSEPSISQPTIAFPAPSIAAQPPTTTPPGPAVHLPDSTAPTAAIQSQPKPSVTETTSSTQSPTVITPTQQLVQQQPKSITKEETGEKKNKN